MWGPSVEGLGIPMAAPHTEAHLGQGGPQPAACEAEKGTSASCLPLCPARGWARPRGKFLLGPGKEIHLLREGGRTLQRGSGGGAGHDLQEHAWGTGTSPRAWGLWEQGVWAGWAEEGTKPAGSRISVGG